MPWVILIIAGLLEAFWAVGLKYTDGFTRLIPSVVVGIAIISSMGLLGIAVKSLPIGTAYAVWVSIGIFGAVIGQSILFEETLRPIQIFFLTLLLIAVTGLKFTSYE